MGTAVEMVVEMAAEIVVEITVEAMGEAMAQTTVVGVAIIVTQEVPPAGIRAQATALHQLLVEMPLPVTALAQPQAHLRQHNQAGPGPIHPQAPPAVLYPIFQNHRHLGRLAMAPTATLQATTILI
jgi:hypothetical protein